MVPRGRRPRLNDNTPIETFSEQACHYCRHWHKVPTGKGECRRNPPKATPRKTSDGDGAAWVITAADDWCGEFSTPPDNMETCALTFAEPVTESPTKLLTEKEAAYFLGVSLAFLRESRCYGSRHNRASAPKFVKAGRMVRYDMNDLLEWVERHKHEPVHYPKW